MKCHYCRRELVWHPVRRVPVHKGGSLYAGKCRGCGWYGSYDNEKPRCPRCRGAIFDGHAATPERREC